MRTHLWNSQLVHKKSFPSLTCRHLKQSWQSSSKIVDSSWKMCQVENIKKGMSLFFMRVCFTFFSFIMFALQRRLFSLNRHKRLIPYSSISRSDICFLGLSEWTMGPLTWHSMKGSLLSLLHPASHAPLL